MSEISQPGADTGSRAFLMVAGVAALGWLVLLGDDPASWVVGLPCVLLCAWYSRSVRPARQVRASVTGWMRLLPYFLWSSVAGGWDVARRVLAPTLGVNPGFIVFELSIPPGRARNFFIQFIGLLPGTLGVWVEENHLRVHVLNVEADHQRALRGAESRVAAAFACGGTMI